jgi:hypothetical protein
MARLYHSQSGACLFRVWFQRFGSLVCSLNDRRFDTKQIDSVRLRSACAEEATTSRLRRANVSAAAADDDVGCCVIRRAGRLASRIACRQRRRCADVDGVVVLRAVRVVGDQHAAHIDAVWPTGGADVVFTTTVLQLRRPRQRRRRRRRRMTK